MLKHLCLYFTLLSCSLSLQGQSYFNKTYDYQTEYDLSSNVLQTIDGGYIASGQVITSTFRGLRFIKINFLGDTLWTKLYRKDSFAYYDGLGSSFIATSDGNYALAGSIFDVTNNNGSGLFIKINSNGDTLFTKKLDTPFWEIFDDCIQNADGSFALAGGSTGFSSGTNLNAWFVKLDSAGNIIWQKNYGGAGDEMFYSLVRTIDGGYALTGYTNSSGAGNYDIYVVKTDSAGNFQWQKTLGTTQGDYATGIIETSNGDLIIIGGYSITSSDRDSYIARLNSSGGLIWQKTYGANKIDEFVGKPIELLDGSLMVAGIISDSLPSNFPRGWIMKLNSSGDSLWSRKYAKWDGQNYFTDFKKTTDNGFIISGYASNSLGIGGGEDMWLIKTDSLGCDSTGCMYDAGIHDPFINSRNHNLYPDPNDGNFTFEYELKGNEKGEFILYNTTGKLINTFQLTAGSHSLQINESALENGVYFYQQRVNGKVIASDKLVIIK